MPTRTTLDRRIAATEQRIAKADRAIRLAADKYQNAQAAKDAAERELAAWQAMPASDEEPTAADQSDQDSTLEGTE